MNARSVVSAVAGVCLIALAAPPTAAVVNYPDMPGVNPGEVDFLQLSESSVTDPEPLYGTPVRAGNLLSFPLLSFQSASTGGAADTTSGQFQMRIRAAAGTFLDGITILEFGDYALTGTGSPATSATVNGSVAVTDLDPGLSGIIPAVLTVAPPPPYALPADSAGSFSGLVQVDLTGLGIREVMLTFNNNLQTTSEPDTSAVVAKGRDGAPGIVTIVPEPITAVLLTLGGVVLIRRRR